MGPSIQPRICCARNLEHSWLPSNQSRSRNTDLRLPLRVAPTDSRGGAHRATG
jgi:hypothetical protein